jgi:hypothetical protein
VVTTEEEEEEEEEEETPRLGERESWTWTGGKETEKKYVTNAGRKTNDMYMTLHTEKRSS